MNKYLLLVLDAMVVLYMLKATAYVFGYGTLPETKDIVYFSMAGFIISIYCFVHMIEYRVDKE